MTDATTAPADAHSAQREPDDVARARQSLESEGSIAIGLAWIRVTKNGSGGRFVRPHTVPTRWDGRFKLVKQS